MSTPVQMDTSDTGKRQQTPQSAAAGAEARAASPAAAVQAVPNNLAPPGASAAAGAGTKRASPAPAPSPQPSHADSDPDEDRLINETITEEDVTDVKEAEDGPKKRRGRQPQVQVPGDAMDRLNELLRKTEQFAQFINPTKPNEKKG
jgi:hypothetical protein